VESVLIPAKTRSTACVSSQVGCSLDCTFCATAQLKRMRNLNPDEIFDQVAMLNKQSIEHFDRPLSNIVFMGMGEPMMNYPNVMKAIAKITSTEGMGMSPRRITVSTSGIPKMIIKMADEHPRLSWRFPCTAPLKKLETKSCRSVLLSRLPTCKIPYNTGLAKPRSVLLTSMLFGKTLTTAQLKLMPW
jgi:23S rRNA (adenine2503-C2)-methyltransferase